MALKAMIRILVQDDGAIDADSCNYGDNGALTGVTHIDVAEDLRDTIRVWAGLEPVEPTADKPAAKSRKKKETT